MQKVEVTGMRWLYLDPLGPDTHEHVLVERDMSGLSNRHEWMGRGSVGQALLGVIACAEVAVVGKRRNLPSVSVHSLTL